MIPRQFFKSATSYDFLGKRFHALIISVALIAAGLVSIGIRGGLNYGIDFTGGTLIQLRFSRPVPPSEVRSVLGGMDVGETAVQLFGNEREMLIRVEKSPASLQEFGHEVKRELEAAIPGESVEVRRTELVGPKVGKDLRRKAILVMVYAFIGIILYISWRFQFKFAVAAIVALLHDVAVTVGILSLADKEISLTVIAALLTIIGYSLNDTIVVSDRIRDNLRAMRRQDLRTIVNTSINQTLSRTVLTSGTTLMVVLALFFLGGEVIHDFALALLVGIIVGTYSSIYIAGSLLVVWQARSKKALAFAKKRR